MTSPAKLLPTNPHDIGAARHAPNGVAGDDLAAEVVAHKPVNRQLMRAFLRSLRRQLGDDSKSRLIFARNG